MNEDRTIDQRVQLRLGTGENLQTSRGGMGAGWRVVRDSHLWRPPTDVLETEEAVLVVVEVAGMRATGFSLTLERKVLTVRGVRSDSGARKAYRQMEIAYGEFSSQVEIPIPIDVANIEATYDDGFLRVVLPKAQPQRIPVRAD